MRARNMEELIQKKFDILNENDRQIWAYIVRHKEQCKQISIQQLAVFCHVSHTTILRFAKKLGFSGYSEMRSFLKWEDKAEILYEEKDMDRNANSFIANIRRFEDMDMDKVCQMIESASRIYTQGSGSTQKLAAQHLKEKFLYQGIFINTIEGASEFEFLSEKFTEEDLVIFYSLSGQNEKQIRKMRSAKESGAKIIGIAMQGKGEFYDLADEVLTFQSEEIHTIGYGFLYYSTLHFHIVNEFLTLKYMEHQLKKQEAITENNEEKH